MNKGAIIYCRCGQLDQVSAQQQSCEDYCRHHSLDVHRVFTDQGEDAVVGNQPALRNLARYCRENKGRIGALVISSPDRITPEILDRVRVRKGFQTLGVDVEAADNGFDLLSPTGLEESIVWVADGAREFNEAWHRRRSEESRASSTK